MENQTLELSSQEIEQIRKRYIRRHIWAVGGATAIGEIVSDFHHGTKPAADFLLIIPLAFVVWVLGFGYFMGICTWSEKKDKILERERAIRSGQWRRVAIARKPSVNWAGAGCTLIAAGIGAHLAWSQATLGDYVVPALVAWFFAWIQYHVYLNNRETIYLQKTTTPAMEENMRQEMKINWPLLVMCLVAWKCGGWKTIAVYGLLAIALNMRRRLEDYWRSQQEFGGQSG